MDDILKKGYEELYKVKSLDRGYKIFPDGKHVRIVSVVPEYDENGELFFSACIRRASLKVYDKYIRNKLDYMKFKTAQEAADYIINLAERINKD